MSATVISFPTENECQEAFDDLVGRTGTPSSASAQEKVEALRQISVEDVYNWQDGAVMIRPAWDPSWFASLDGPERLDQVSRFPGWIDNLMIGSTKDETVNLRPAWSALDLDQIRTAVASVIPDPSMRSEIIEAYGLDANSHADVLTGVVNLTTDAFFGMFPPLLGRLPLPISVFRFDQPDTFEQSHFKGCAYHCIDTPFLCRLPAVAGPLASEEMRKTADHLTQAVAEFVHGVQPWEAYHVGGARMIFNGTKTGTAALSDDERWRRFVSTKERLSCLIDTSRLLMTYKFNSASK